MKKNDLIKVASFFMIVCSFVACSEKKTETKSSDYRPAYHFTSDSNWINDPNGLVYVNGEYHLFYQYNPFGKVWGHMSWGHSVSKDLIKWESLPIALHEEWIGKGKDTAMIFSGSAVIDKNNTSGFGTLENPAMVAVYTAFVHNGKDSIGNYIPVVQNQCLAYSTDKGRSWTKYKGNPVLDIYSLEFRDPKVFWYEPQQKWVMIIAKPDEREAWFYDSKNLKDWRYMSRWGKTGDTLRAWECPDLIEMPVQGTSEKKWVMLLSAGNPHHSYVGMQYFVGDFDGKTFSTKQDYKEPVYLDFGKDFYAAVSYNDVPDGRKIMVGWLNNWEYANDIPTGNFWRGAFAIPRQLSLIKTNAVFQLLQEPVTDLNSKRKEVFSLPEKQVESSFDISYKGDSYELEMIIEPGTASTCGIEILKGKKETTVIKYDKSTGFLTFDRRSSGDTSFNKKFPSVEKVKVDLKDGKIKLRILVDKCIAEVFINDGEKTLTDLVFPKEKEGGIRLFAEGGTTIFKNVKVWTL